MPMDRRWRFVSSDVNLDDIWQMHFNAFEEFVPTALDVAFDHDFCYVDKTLAGHHVTIGSAIYRIKHGHFIVLGVARFVSAKSAVLFKLTKSLRYLPNTIFDEIAAQHQRKFDEA